MSKGALNDLLISEMMESSFINNADPRNINPGSLDVTLSDECYRTNGVSLPTPGQTVRQMLSDCGARRHDLSNPLESHVTYMVRLKESWALPSSVYGYGTPKSSTGRTDAHVRVVADWVERFDTMPAGFKGEIWLAVCSKSFPILLTEGEKMMQVRLFNSDTRFSETELEIAMARHPLIYNPNTGDPFTYQEMTPKDGDGSVLLSIDLTGKGIIGWAARGTSKILDFRARNLNPDDFFELVSLSTSGRLHLRRGGFYILSTYQTVCVPPWLACEMTPMDHRSGEFRSHYAGFIDPGWGWGQDGKGQGRQLTLELRPFEDIVLRPGQAVARITFEKMVKPPKSHYDELDTSHYRRQAGPGLSKQFTKIA